MPGLWKGGVWRSIFVFRAPLAWLHFFFFFQRILLTSLPPSFPPSLHPPSPYPSPPLSLCPPTQHPLDYIAVDDGFVPFHGGHMSVSCRLSEQAHPAGGTDG